MRTGMSLFLVFVSSAAFALNNRSAVSMTGNDTNPCTTTQPCRSFGAAMVQTAAGGEIIALDSAGYGPFVIQQAVAVSGAPGVHAAITATGNAAIHIMQPSNSGHVVLRNLVLLGTGGGAEGIRTENVSEVSISHLTIIGFSSCGIFVLDSTAVIDHCQLLDNTAGVDVAFGKAIVSNSRIAGCADGVDAVQTASIDIAHSVISNNSIGVKCGPFNSGGTSTILVDDCSISGNDIGVVAGTDLGTALIFLSNAAIFANNTGVLAKVGGAVGSYGNNRIDGNNVNLGTSTSLATLTLH